MKRSCLIVKTFSPRFVSTNNVDPYKLPEMSSKSKDVGQGLSKFSSETESMVKSEHLTGVVPGITLFQNIVVSADPSNKLNCLPLPGKGLLSSFLK